MKGMVIMKKLFSVFLALTMAFSLGIAAQADEYETKDTITVSGYECWNEDGEYFTEIDGEKCQVIILDNFIQPMTLSSYVQKQSTASKKPKYDVDLSNGEQYEGRINITQGDDITPRFFRKRSPGTCSFEISTGFVFNTSYNVTISFEMYDEYGNLLNNYLEHETLSFNFMIKTHKFFVGTLTNADCVCQITFHQSGSSETERNFKYWIKAVS